MNINEKNFGDHEGKLIINHKNTKYTIPFLLHYTSGSVFVNQQNQKLFFEVNHPEKWSFAKISVINSKNGKTYTTTMTPNKNSTIEIYENGEYWIDAKIRVNGTTLNAFNTIKISTLSDNVDRIKIDIPEKQIGVISGIVILVAIVGLLKRR
jgi:minor extracellular serine protease Vpr